MMNEEISSASNLGEGTAPDLAGSSPNTEDHMHALARLLFPGSKVLAYASPPILPWLRERADKVCLVTSDDCEDEDALVVGGQWPNVPASATAWMRVPQTAHYVHSRDYAAAGFCVPWIPDVVFVDCACPTVVLWAWQPFARPITRFVVKDAAFKRELEVIKAAYTVDEVIEGCWFLTARKELVAPWQRRW